MKIILTLTLLTMFSCKTTENSQLLGRNEEEIDADAVITLEDLEPMAAALSKKLGVTIKVSGNLDKNSFANLGRDYATILKQLDNSVALAAQKSTLKSCRTITLEPKFTDISPIVGCRLSSRILSLNKNSGDVLLREAALVEKYQETIAMENLLITMPWEQYYRILTAAPEAKGQLEKFRRYVAAEKKVDIKTVKPVFEFADNGDKKGDVNSRAGYLFISFNVNQSLVGFEAFLAAKSFSSYSLPD